ncbi:hypothetical protein SCLCIDRAFT_12328 [Scleroderma citrinum Foug A]|uniref:Uncharacterized protein n=1 Tax=Scleroderma citrinum Foug A TaxID=1036808 RepID=A0A0C3D286_9AGAM|nr:hypothetical protein SCLCIDRAFT_12328 [Scleroderma citrinum Foug A]
MLQIQSLCLLLSLSCWLILIKCGPTIIRDGWFGSGSYLMLEVGVYWQSGPVQNDICLDVLVHHLAWLVEWYECGDEHETKGWAQGASVEKLEVKGLEGTREFVILVVLAYLMEVP